MAQEQENQTESAPTRPSEEAVTAFLNGSEAQQVEQPGAQSPSAEKPVEATAPAASQPDIAAQIRELLKSELNPIQSELGQLRKLRSEFSRMQTQTNQPITPASWQQMKPEEQSAVLEMVEHAWTQKFGKQWEQMNSRFEQQQQRESLEAVEHTAREIAGDQWQELDPIMGRVYDDLLKKAEGGDSQSRRLVYEIANTYSGVAHLVNLAKAEMGQTVKANEDKAKADRQTAAKRAGTPLQTSPNTQTDDGLANFKNLSTADMRKKLVELGVLG